MKKYKTLIAIASILFIKFIYVIKGLPPMDISTLIPIVITCLIVSVGKVGIYYGMALGTKKIIGKVKTNNDNINNNSEYEKEKELEKKTEKIEETLNFNDNKYEQSIIMDKPKTLVKKRNNRGRL